MRCELSTAAVRPGHQPLHTCASIRPAPPVISAAGPRRQGEHRLGFQRCGADPGQCTHLTSLHTQQMPRGSDGQLRVWTGRGSGSHPGTACSWQRRSGPCSALCAAAGAARHGLLTGHHVTRVQQRGNAVVGRQVDAEALVHNVDGRLRGPAALGGGKQRSTG